MTEPEKAGSTMQLNREIRKREAERLAADGMSTAEIANQLGVHWSTANDYLVDWRSKHRSSREDSINEPVQLRTSAMLEASTSWSDPLNCESAWNSTIPLPGVYKWFLGGQLPESFNWPEHLAPIAQGDLIYVGKALNLRRRAKHHRLPTSGSTLRRTLASLMGFPGVWIGKSAHPRVSREHSDSLTAWMGSNLLMSFRLIGEHESLNIVEKQLRVASVAPLNKDSLTREQQHASEIGKIWQASAVRR